jgi:signal transduction histidine kinase
MRALIFELRPESLEQNGLVVVLDRQAEALRVRHRVEVTTDLGEEPASSLEVKQAVYRIAQEALHNIVKHAGATRVDVLLDCAEGRLRLEVRDNGAGFVAAGDVPGHLGLRSMRERAAQLGGTLTVHSAPGEGTRVVAEVPLKKPV